MSTNTDSLMVRKKPTPIDRLGARTSRARGVKAEIQTCLDVFFYSSIDSCYRLIPLAKWPFFIQLFALNRKCCLRNADGLFGVSVCHQLRPTGGIDDRVPPGAKLRRFSVTGRKIATAVHRVGIFVVRSHKLLRLDRATSDCQSRTEGEQCFFHLFLLLNVRFW